MEKAHIKIYIQPEDYDTRYAQEFCIDLDTPLIADIIDPIHTLHNPCATPLKFFVEKRRTCLIGNREGVAKRLSMLFTEKILETFEGKDTINGYSQKEWKEMHGPKQYVTPSQLHYIAKVYPEIIDENDTEEYDKLEDKSYWEVAARMINKIIKNKEKC